MKNCRISEKIPKSILGELLWLLQTRFGLSYFIIRVAAEVDPAMEDASLAVDLNKLVNKVIQKSKSREMFISYGRIAGFSRLKQRSDLSGVRIFSVFRFGARRPSWGKVDRSAIDYLRTRNQPMRMYSLFRFDYRFFHAAYLSVCEIDPGGRSCVSRQWGRIKFTAPYLFG